MISFTDKLQGELQEELRQAGMEHRELLLRAERSFYIVRNYLQQLKEFIVGYTFVDTSDEIRFFKEVKPAFQKELIYWSEIIDIETHRPVGNRRVLKHYYNRVLDRIDLYFRKNSVLYTYYKLGRSENDLHLFTRAAESLALIPEYSDYSLDLDTSFSTVNSSRLAKLIAFEEVHDHIKKELDVLAGRVHSPSGDEEQIKGLHWSGTKAEFIEFFFGLYCAQVVNNGKATLKEVMEVAQYMFNIKVTHYYGYINQAIRIRKKTRTPFLHRVIEKSEGYMDSNDEFSRVK